MVYCRKGLHKVINPPPPTAIKRMCQFTRTPQPYSYPWLVRHVLQKIRNFKSIISMLGGCSIGFIFNISQYIRLKNGMTEKNNTFLIPRIFRKLFFLMFHASREYWVLKSFISFIVIVILLFLWKSYIKFSSLVYNKDLT